MEAFEIIEYLSEFSSLNALQLEEEMEKCIQEIGEFNISRFQLTVYTFKFFQPKLTRS